MTNPLNIRRNDITSDGIMNVNDEYDTVIYTNLLDRDMIETLYEGLESHHDLTVRVDPDHTDNLMIVALPHPQYNENEVIILAMYLQTEYVSTDNSFAVNSVTMRYTDGTGWIVISNVEAY